MYENVLLVNSSYGPCISTETDGFPVPIAIVHDNLASVNNINVCKGYTMLSFAVLGSS